MNCARLISKSVGDLCAPNVKGYKERSILINYDDLDFDNIKYDTNPHIINSLVLKEGAIGYKVLQRGAQPFNGTNSSMAQATYQNDVTNTVQIVVPKDAIHTEQIVQPLVNGAQVVLILESKSKGVDGQSAFEVWGIDGGLTASATNSDINGDAGKNYIITLTEVTTNAATFIHNTSYEATKLMVESLAEE